MIDGTLTVAQATAAPWDVIVVGAGPAGSVCAATCAAVGARTLLLDRSSFPRDKLCGCCLSGRAIAVIERLAGPSTMESLRAHRLRRLTLRAAGGHATVNLRAGSVVSRHALDAALVDVARDSRAATLFSASATLDHDDGGVTRALTLATGETLRASVVVGADGLHGRLFEREPGMAWRIRSGGRMGAGCVLDGDATACAPGEVVMCCDSRGYVGMTRLESGALDIACAFDPAAVKRSGGPAPLAASILDGAGVATTTRLATATWRGTPLLTRSRRVAGRRVMAIGDAAGYVEPVTGEGMTWAVESGQLAAAIAVDGVRDWRHSHARAWVRVHTREIRRRQQTCRVLAAILRRPALLAGTMTLLRAQPDLCAGLASLAHGGRATA